MYASVLVDIALSACDTFDYKIPDGIKAEIGARVLVPFGKQNIEGFIMEIRENTNVSAEKVREITRIYDDFAPILPEFMAISDAICNKFKLRKIDVLRLFIPPALRGRKKPRVPKNKEIQAIKIAPKEITLTPDQTNAIDEICAGANLLKSTPTPPAFLLHGVTGSGKTEVYMRVIENVLAQNKTAIMLVPEIGLTPQVLGNFRARFGGLCAILHSNLTPAERYDEWFRLFSGEAKIAIGARSAIFAPLQNIGIIIIDEEHDASYQSESNPRYNTHEIAEIRAAYNHATLVLGSATPSIATYSRGVPRSGDTTIFGFIARPRTPPAQHQFILLELKSRVNDISMPPITIVDMTQEIRAGNGGIFSRLLVSKLTEVISAKKQAIIFLNRRGFSSSLTCKSCGWVAKCDHCDVSLVYHKEDNLLKCHYCSARQKVPITCPKCGSNYLKYGATGTQKVVDELQKVFPDVPIFRMDADSIKHRDDLIATLDKFSASSPAILVGTQMLAKGHHFPNVELVGIIDADNSLHFADYRATERTFALVTQVAGRAGRGGSEKKIDADRGGAGGNAPQSAVILQTYIPTHYVYKLATDYDYKRFFEKELNTRAVTKYPPFATIVRILVTGERDDKIKDFLQGVMLDLRKRNNDFIYLSAMKSPIGRLDDKFRYQIIARFEASKEKLIDFIDETIKSHAPKGVSVFLEINPQNLS